ncbi:MAG: YceI family protein [Flavobacteriales bacterium]|nr:YceI family protein [Flavobacteriales bacterium]NNK80726.1 YceI family protein [Flavobacteriales bacterium]
MKKVLSVLVLLFAFTLVSYGQASNPDADIKEEYECKNMAGECSIKGTSTLHDWESKIEDFSINAVRDGDLIDADFKVRVKSIKSGHSGMDKNTYKALYEDQYPEIRFTADQLQIEANRFIRGHGDLTIAGTTRKIPVEFSMTSWIEDTMTIDGEITINMTDYGIKPPVALFGTVKTGEEIVFVINTTLNKVNN